MFTFFLALLTISLSGLVILFIFKSTEARTGKVLFLPFWLHERDNEIERGARHMARAVVETLQRFLVAAWRSIVVLAKQLPGRFHKIRWSRRKKEIKHNGGSSVYFKQVMEHKNSIRNSESNSE